MENEDEFALRARPCTSSRCAPRATRPSGPARGAIGGRRGRKVSPAPPCLRAWSRWWPPQASGGSPPPQVVADKASFWAEPSSRARRPSRSRLCGGGRRGQRADRQPGGGGLRTPPQGRSAARADAGRGAVTETLRAAHGVAAECGAEALGDRSGDARPARAGRPHRRARSGDRRRPLRPDAARARGAGAGRGGQDHPPDRRRAVHEREDRERHVPRILASSRFALAARRARWRTGSAWTPKTKGSSEVNCRCGGVCLSRSFIGMTGLLSHTAATEHIQDLRAAAGTATTGRVSSVRSAAGRRSRAAPPALRLAA